MLVGAPGGVKPPERILAAVPMGPERTEPAASMTPPMLNPTTIDRAAEAGGRDSLGLALAFDAPRLRATDYAAPRRCLCRLGAWHGAIVRRRGHLVYAPDAPGRVVLAYFPPHPL